MRRFISLLVLTVMLMMSALPVCGADNGNQLPAASGFAVDGDTLYIADSYHRAIWKMEDGVAELLAGQTELTDLSGQPAAGYRDGSFTQAAFDSPWAVVPYEDGLLVSDSGNHVLRYLDLNRKRVYTAAGTGEAGYRDGSSRVAFDTPTGLAVDDDGTVYIADTGNNVIRAMDSDGNVTTYAGGEEGCSLGTLKQARFSQPTGLCYADGVLYVADSGNHRIVAIENGMVTLVAGAQLTGDAAVEGDYLDGKEEEARFANPQGIAVDDEGAVYVADTGNSAVRVIRGGFVVTLISGEADIRCVSPRGLLVQGDTLLVGDVFTNTLTSYDVRQLTRGWKKVGNNWYYLDSNGSALSGWLQDGTHWYYLNADGVMQTGWRQIDGEWYYLKGSGAMATGWLEWKDEWYYLYPSGRMAVSTTIDGYTVDAGGVWVP